MLGSSSTTSNRASGALRLGLPDTVPPVARSDAVVMCTSVAAPTAVGLDATCELPERRPSAPLRRRPQKSCDELRCLRVGPMALAQLVRRDPGEVLGQQRPQPVPEAAVAQVEEVQEEVLALAVQADV